MNTLNSVVMKDLTPYPYENGGWYFTRKGYVGTNNETYFYQYGGATNLYNLNVTVILTS